MKARLSFISRKFWKVAALLALSLFVSGEVVAALNTTSTGIPDGYGLTIPPEANVPSSPPSPDPNAPPDPGIGYLTEGAKGGFTEVENARGGIIYWSEFALDFVASIVFIMLLYAGWQAMTGYSDAGRRSVAGKTIWHVALGMAILLGSYVIIDTFLSSFLTATLENV